jgi:hypothetical protein
MIRSTEKENEIVVKYNPEGKIRLSIGEIFNEARKATTKEEAKKYINDYVAYILKIRREHEGTENEEVSIEEELGAMRTAKHNIGYFAAHYEAEEYFRILDLFEIKPSDVWTKS